MIERSYSFIWGILAFVIYAMVVGLLIFYFNTKRSDLSKHYVKKDTHRIQVSIATKQKTNKQKMPLPKPKVAPKPNIVKKNKLQKKETLQKETPKKVTSKKVIQEKIVKKRLKKKEENLTKVSKIKPKKLKEKEKEKPKEKKKKIQKPKVKVKKSKPKKVKKPKKASDLFSKVEIKSKSKKINKEEPKKVPQKTTNTKEVLSASQRIRNTLKNQKSSDSGIENAYFHKVQSMLENWPAQSDFAGEKASVSISVKPTGQFTFKVTSASNNAAFNQGLKDFLRQLQRLGLGRHHANRSYTFNVEFIAKE